MYYMTVKLPPFYHQVSLEDLLFDKKITGVINANETNTRTYTMEYIKPELQRSADVYHLITVLDNFNAAFKYLREKPRHELYKEFYIPKKSGGLRHICAPLPELMDALRCLKGIFERDFGALYHTSAFAYIPSRSTIKCMQRHVDNESKWYAKFDLSNFFGSTTIEYTMKMFEQIYPFCLVCDIERGRKALYDAIELAFLDGGLPQGTPISPLITNVIMIPVDYKLSNTLRDWNKQHYVYTRYADDFQISSKYSFSFRAVEKLIVDTLAEFGAPFTVNAKKTRYGSSSGRNWNLGIMINQENKMTVGSKNKKRFETMLFNYLMDRSKGVAWPLEDLQTLEGLRNYYRMVEGVTIDNICNHIGQKFNISDVVAVIRSDLSN